MNVNGFTIYYFNLESFIIFRRIQHILVKPVTDWGYLQLNSSAPLPDSLLINIKTPPELGIAGLENSPAGSSR